MKLLSAKLLKNFKGKLQGEGSCWLKIEQDDVLSMLRAKSTLTLREADELLARAQQEFALAIAKMQEILVAEGANIHTQEIYVSSSSMDPFKLQCKIELAGLDEAKAKELGEALREKLRENEIWLSLKDFS